MEKKASLTSQVMKADMERSCLLYFNDILFSKGEISQEEYPQSLWIISGAFAFLIFTRENQRDISGER